MDTIQVFRPSITDAEIEAVVEVLRSGWIGLGPKTAQFEQEYAEYVGAEHAVATNSATSALHLALVALGIGPGDEVLVPTITFVSTAHVVEFCGATPVFCDVEADTLNLDVEDAERRVTSRTKAIVPVHYGGLPCDMNSVFLLASDGNLFIVEDAAHACGAERKGTKIGGLSTTDLTCFSFHAVKNLTTGDGGMITTNRLELAQKLRRLRWCGINKSTWDRTMDAEGVRSRYSQYAWYYEVAELGFKAHMNDIAAAIGLVQLRRLDDLNGRRREIAARYDRAFSELNWLKTPVVSPDVIHARHNYVIQTEARDALNAFLKERGIATGVHYMPVHLHPYYQALYETRCPVAERVWTKLLTLPMYPDLSEDQLDHIVESVRAFQ